MLTIWGRFDSSNVQALLWAVSELELPFRRFDIGERFGGTDTPGFRAMNPNGTIPVLRDGDGPALWETGAILRYLATRYAPESFWPSEPVARANVDRWAEWAKINVTLGFTGPVFWRVWRTPAKQRDPAAIAAAITALTKKLAIAETQLSAHRFLTGDTLTLADIQFGHILYRYYMIPIDRPDLPCLRAYFERLTERPAYQNHVMVSFDALRDQCPTP
ncbi:glutathione S-transferase family protein [Pararhodobacter sp.]|uniref:glutathione S-transferase family protein n=1 Tax=Pararhodobacter sp. TaxID=2127056 RepID=UPI002FDC7BE5